MDLISELRSRVASFYDDLSSGKMMQEIILDNEGVICDMNAEDQLYEQGVNSLGVDISDYAPYSPVTVWIKEEKGQPTDRVTLRDEGDFESSFYVTASLDGFAIRASDWKAEKLIKKYGTDIMGLTEENMDSLRWDYVYFELMQRLKKELYG